MLIPAGKKHNVDSGRENERKTKFTYIDKFQETAPKLERNFTCASLI